MPEPIKPLTLTPARPEYRFTIPADPECVRWLREWLELCLDSWCLTDLNLIYSAKLVVSELATNAIRHTPHMPGDEIALLVTHEEDSIRVGVWDSDIQHMPKLQAPALIADIDDLEHVPENGRGLDLVSMLGDMVCVTSFNPDGKTVWVRMDLPQLETAQ